MTNLEKAAKTYRLPMITDQETLGCRWQTVINYGDKVILAGYYYNQGNSYFGAVYEFTGKNHTCEDEIKLTAISETQFEDNGHAIAWALSH